MARRTTSSSTDESKETEAKVDDYPERTYADVVTDEQRKFLKELGVTLEEAAAVSETNEE